jgi:hypothetical protein
MMTKQDFQDILNNLREKYGDITKDSDSLLAMLENNFKPVPRRQPTISMCDIEADKIYLWINTKDDLSAWIFGSEENSENRFDNIGAMKLLYSPGYQIARDEEQTDEELDFEEVNQIIEETLRSGQEFYGTGLFPNLTSFAGQEITCNKRGAESLRRHISRNTGWNIHYPCPLILLTQLCSFYRRGHFQEFSVNVDSLESHSVLYNRGDGSVEWNGWSGPFLLYELIPSTNFSSFNYPTGLPLNR